MSLLTFPWVSSNVFSLRDSRQSRRGSHAVFKHRLLLDFYRLYIWKPGSESLQNLWSISLGHLHCRDNTKDLQSSVPVWKQRDGACSQCFHLTEGVKYRDSDNHYGKICGYETLNSPITHSSHFVFHWQILFNSQDLDVCIDSGCFNGRN